MIKCSAIFKKTTAILCVLMGLFLCFVPNYTNAQDLKKEVNFAQQKALPFYNLKKIGNTSIFQGNQKKRKYFEGWYFKMVAKDGASIISVIPGISLSVDGSEQHSFIHSFIHSVN